ncbi:hypothetical protein LUW75_03320 [Streptomyces sp. MRC013]|uniref:hypothetical protein n=1 Tax=Streptomyces sp. MRC013 TaxID=2898276 RepID=UPI0020264D26|nr:hypothetical protein [Streptomyces sp. MRC013]URM89199.1 hypothetical protein LUW75_03320 [Streptomyces sp. MRC013]
MAETGVQNRGAGLPELPEAASPLLPGAAATENGITVTDVRGHLAEDGEHPVILRPAEHLGSARTGLQ